MVLEVLPEAMRFRVLLNQSNDDIVPLRLGEVVFPQDSGRIRALHACDARTVVDELWRDGRVPEWVDLSVVDVRRKSTAVEMLCCGRFTDDESLLYHHAVGWLAAGLQVRYHRPAGQVTRRATSSTCLPNIASRSNH